ncbi:unnamed protein product [Bursaphelenchus xylophilus]|uniref:(pine wood nematode) hypothetical protein n=1 Tax=Bursaphelenchus xylophilus TaxID=6326 RepID=A0A1I7SWD7_BURXY|nr:unnamed protein product [Bursaphelenchus xylophilus]CAG9099251.1 unnamed protein product [Bursaphelenchus xylophilus]
MKLRTNDSAFGSEMYKSTSSRGSVRSSLWSSLFSESNVPSDVAFYRRASWLEEYANQRAQYLDDKSVERRRIREQNRPRLINYLIRLLPCTRPKQKHSEGNNKLQGSDSSRTSLNSMLQETEEATTRPQRQRSARKGADPRQSANAMAAFGVGPRVLNTDYALRCGKEMKNEFPK